MRIIQPPFIGTAEAPPSGGWLPWLFNSNQITGGKMLKNVAGQNITALLLDTDGVAVTTGTTTVYVTGDAGTQASMGTAIHEGNGCWSIDVTQAESNYDDIGFTWVNTGAVTVHQHVFTDQSYNRLGAPAGASIAADIAVVEGQTDDIGTAGAGLTGIPWNSAWDVEVQSECADAITAASLATAAALATVDSNVDAILLDTNELQTDDVPGLIAALNDLSAAEVNTEVDTALADYDGPTKTEMDSAFTEIKGATWASGTDTLEAIRDRGDAAWTTGAGGTPPQLLQSTTIATLSTQTSFTLTAGSADDDAYNGAVIVITDSATSTQKAVGEVSDYTGSTKTITLSADPGIFTMAVGDTVEIIAALGAAGSGASAADVWTYGTRVLTANTNLNDPTANAIADQVWDELQSGHVGAGTFGEIATEIANILTDTNELQTDDVPGLIAALNDLSSAEVNAECDTAISDAALATAAALATVDANVDSVLADTGTDGVVISATTANQLADAILNRDMSSVSDTNARTMLNALRFLRNKWSISGTTLTVTKEDDSTSAWTATVSTDAAADPVTGNDPA